MTMEGIVVTIDTNSIVTATEANQNFSKVAMQIPAKRRDQSEMNGAAIPEQRRSHSDMNGVTSL